MNDRIVRILVGTGIVAFGCGLARPAPAQAPASEALTLRRAVELALEHAPQLAAVRAAREGSGRPRIRPDAFRPSAWLSTSPGYTYGFPGLVAGRVPSIAALEVRQTIYDPNRRSEMFQAQAQASDAEGALERSCHDTIEKTIAVYARSWVDQSLADVARRRTDAAETIRKRVEALAGEGRRTDLDRERARLQGARARQKLLNAESDRDLDLLELKRLIGWPGSAPIALSDPNPSLPDLSGSGQPRRGARGGPRAEVALPRGRATRPVRASRGQELGARHRGLRPVPAPGEVQQLRQVLRHLHARFRCGGRVDRAAALDGWAPLRRGAARAGPARARGGAARGAEADLELAVRRAEADVARSTAEKSLSRRSQGIAEQALSASQLLVREGRTELSDLDETQLGLAEADEEAARAGLSALLERGAAAVAARRARGRIARLGSPCARP